MATPFVLTARIQTALDTGSLTRVVNRIRREMAARPIELKVVVDDARLRRLATELGTVDASARKAQAGMAGFANSVKLAATRFMAFTLAASVMIKLSMAFREGFKQAAEFDREIVRLTQVTGKSAQGLKPLVREITNLSESLGVSSLKMVEMSRILAQTGMSAKDTAIALKAIAKTELAPTFSDIKKTAEGAIAAMRQFNIEAKDLEATLGAINAVSKRFAVESDDIITAIRRTGGVFQAAGGQINELIAIFTSVRATTRETAETIATGLRTIFTRIQRPKTIKFLRQFGIELTDLQGKFVGPMEAIRRLSVSLRGMETTDLQFGRIIEQLGGFRQVGKVIPMITKHETAVKALAVAQGGANSLTIDAAKAQKALLVQVEKVKEEFHDMMRKMLASEGFKAMISMTLKLASAMIKLVESLEPVLPMLMALSAIKLGGMAMGGIGRMRVGGMAKGGVVPGVGNRDTVPAVLTPGEFVIKKSSAKKLGYDNLSGMNKYAKGGVIHATGKFGGMFIDPHLMEDTPAKGASYAGPLRGAPALANKINAGAIRKQGKGRATQVGAALGAKQRLEFPGGGQEQMLRSLSRHNPEAYAALLTNRGIKAGSSLAAVAKAAPLTGMSGGALGKFGFGKKQIALSMQRAGLFTGGAHSGTLAERSKVKNKQGQVTPADLTSGVVKMMGDPFLFGVSSVTRKDFADKYKLHTDQMLQDFAKNTLPPALVENIKQRAGGKSVEGHMFEAYLLAKSGQGAISTDSSEDFDFLKGMITQDLASLFGDPMGTQLKGFSALDAKRTKGGTAVSSLVKKAMNTFASMGKVSGLNLQFTPGPGDFGKNTAPFMLAATGGSVGSGSDTVPALLTPGEFVINKKSASRIGLGTLSSMNRYAAGGVVTSGRHNYGVMPGGPAPPLPPTSPAGPGTGSGGGGGGMGGMGMMMMLTMIPALIPQLTELGGATEETTQQVQDFSGIMMGATMGLMLFGDKLMTAGGGIAAGGLLITAAAVAWAHSQEKAAARAKEAAIKSGNRSVAMAKAEEEARAAEGKKMGAVVGVVFTALALLGKGLIVAAAAIVGWPVVIIGLIAAGLAAAFGGVELGKTLADAEAEAAKKMVIARMDAIDATKKFAEGMRNIEKQIKSGNLAAASAGFVTEVTELSKAIEKAKRSGMSLDSEELSTMTDRMSDAGAATATHLSRLAVEAAKAGGDIGLVIGSNKELIQAHGTAKSAVMALAAAQLRASAIAMPSGTAKERKAQNAALKRASDMDVKAAMIRFDAEKDIKAQMKADFEQQKRHTEALKANTALFLHQARIVNDLGTVMTALSVATMEAADTMRGISAAASLGMGKVGATKLKGTRGKMLSGNLADADTAEYANLLNQLFAPLGQLGATIGKELTQAQDAFSGASEFVVQHTDAKTGQMMKGWEGKLKKHLGNVPAALKEKILTSIKDIEGPKTPQKIKEALKEAEGYLDPVKKQAMELYKLQLDHVNRLNSAYDKQRKLLGAMAKSQKDWVSHGFKAMAVMRKHMGMESSLALAQGQHAAEQQAILGQAGLGGLGGNIAVMGNHLRNTNKKIVAAEKSLEGMVGDPTKAGLAADNLARLKNESETLTKALKHAGNMAGQRAVIEEKIAKAKAERETRKGLLEEFTFGSGKERGKLAKDLKVTQFAAAVGDMDKIPGKLRGTVLKTLDRFKDTLIPGSGGRTGEEVKNQLMARQAQKMGASPQQIQRILMRGREEEMLIAMLGQLFMAESAARMELMKTQKDMHIVLTNDIQKLHMDFVNKLTQVLQQIQGGGAAGARGNVNAGRQFPGGAPVGAGGAWVPVVGGQGVAGGGTAGQRAGRIQANQARANARAAQEEADKAAAEKKAADERKDAADKAKEKADRDLAVAVEAARQKAAANTYDAVRARQRQRRPGESPVDAHFRNLREGNPGPGGYRAAGGVIYAQGGFQARGTDTVPAMLTPGEFVIRKSSAQKIGYGNLHSINRYDQGGKVHKHPHSGRLIRNRNVRSDSVSNEANTFNQRSNSFLGDVADVAFGTGSGIGGSRDAYKDTALGVTWRGGINALDSSMQQGARSLGSSSTISQLGLIDEAKREGITVPQLKRRKMIEKRQLGMTRKEVAADNDKLLEEEHGRAAIYNLNERRRQEKEDAAAKTARLDKERADRVAAERKRSGMDRPGYGDGDRHSVTETAEQRDKRYAQEAMENKAYLAQQGITAQTSKDTVAAYNKRVAGQSSTSPKFFKDQPRPYENLPEEEAQAKHTAGLRKRLNEEHPSMAPLGEDVGRTWQQRQRDFDAKMGIDSFRDSSVPLPDIPAPVLGKKGRLQRKSERFRGSADRRRAAAKAKQEAWLAKREEVTGRKRGTPTGHTALKPGSVTPVNLKAKWKKDSKTFHERARKKAQHEGYRSAEARSFHLREKRRAYVHQQGRGDPGLGARGRGGVRRRMPRYGGRRQRRIDDKYEKEAGYPDRGVIDPRLGAGGGSRGQGLGGGGAQFSVPAPQQGFGREVNVSGIATQVQDALGPVMAQFQGVNVEHNINHQGLNVTGGDGIGSAIIQQILPQIVGLIKNITTQLINNSSQDATGKITTRPG